MRVPTKAIFAVILLATLAILGMESSASAADKAWQVSKASGEFWVTHDGVQLASVTTGTSVGAGDYVMTGQNGRVLLVRGEETMLISPNTVISIPNQSADGMSTTIVQRVGTIALEVEKRNVQHFEVQTPFLAAVVKGTKFAVSVDGSGSHVDVTRGQVEVSANESGQTAMVMPGQRAKVPAQGSENLSLSGSGTLGPIWHGTPRASSVTALLVPAGGLAPSDSQPAAKRIDKQNGAASRQSEARPAPPQHISFGGGAARAEYGNDDSWTSQILAKVRSLGDGTGLWSSGDDSTLGFGLPIGVGFFVTASVVVKRQWQRHKKK
jgi:hypothetical protein